MTHGNRQILDHVKGRQCSSLMWPFAPQVITDVVIADVAIRLPRSSLMWSSLMWPFAPQVMGTVVVAGAEVSEDTDEGTRPAA
jgi:hypothetical protein